MYYVYILYSETTDSYYCGQTNDLVSRLKRHNSGETQSIRNGRPWRFVGFIAYEKRTEAMSMEKIIKKRGIKRWLINNQEQLKKIEL